MHSILFSLGNFPIRSFGFSIAIGLIVVYFVIARLARRENIPPDFASNIISVAMLSGLIGARAAYVMEHWTSHYAAHPGAAFRIWDGGLMFYGGFILAFAVILIYIRFAKLRLWTVLDILAVALPLGHAFGRIGCFLNGCCYGRVVDTIGCGAFERSIAVIFPKDSIPFNGQVNDDLIFDTAQNSLPVLPAQLIESAANFAIFALLLALALLVRTRPGFRTGLYMALYAIVRFFVENLRSDPRIHFGVFSVSQTISLILLPIGALLILLSFFRAREEPQTQDDPHIPPPPPNISRPRARMADVFDKHRK